MEGDQIAADPCRRALPGGTARSGPAPSRPGGRPIAKLLLLSAILGSAWAARSIFMPVQDLVRVDLGLSDVQMSFAQGAAMSVPGALLSLALGRFVDVFNRTRLLLALSVVTTVGAIGTAFADSFASLLFCRAAAGIGLLEEAVVFSLLADLFPPDQRGRAMLVAAIAEYGGFSLGFALGGWLQPLASAILAWRGLAAWREAQLLFGCIGFVTTLLLLLLREPARREMSAGAGQGFRASCAMLWRLGPILWPILVGQVAMITVNNSVSVWVMPVLLRAQADGALGLGSTIAAIVLLAAFGGAVIGGAATDRLNGRWGGALLVMVVASAIALPASLFPLCPDRTLSLALFGILLLCNAAAGLASGTYGLVAISNDLRGLWLGLSGTVTILVAFAIAPTVVAQLSDVIGGRHALAAGLTALSLVASAVALGANLLAWRAARHGSSSDCPLAPAPAVPIG